MFYDVEIWICFLVVINWICDVGEECFFFDLVLGFVEWWGWISCYLKYFLFFKFCDLLGVLRVLGNF